MALTESVIGRGHGCAVVAATDLPAHVFLFSESAGRAVVSVDVADEDRLVELAATHGVPAVRLGETGGPRVVIDGLIDLTTAELTDAWEHAIPRLLGEHDRARSHPA